MPGVLNSLKILDFSTLLPGPYASMLLADLGAEVLRIEAPNRADLVRMLPPYDEGVSVSHAYLNRSKRSMVLDLKQPEAISIIQRLVQSYDIVLEQFRPGVMQRLGLSYAELNTINPRLIYCSITGYGQTGPYKDRAGHDINYLALSGISSYTGRKQGGPLPLGIQVADIAGGSHHAVMGILAAVIHRQVTGEGQHIDISMADAALAMNALTGAAYLAGQQTPDYESGVLDGGSYYDYYETLDNRYLSVGSLEPQFLSQLCQALGKSELASQAMMYNTDLQPSIKAEFKALFKTKTLQQWLEVFKQYDACVEPVLTLSEAVQHPQCKARDMVVAVPKAEGGSQRQLACPIKMSKTPADYKFIGVALGQHTQAILTELGYSQQQVIELKQKNVIG